MEFKFDRPSFDSASVSDTVSIKHPVNYKNYSRLGITPIDIPVLVNDYYGEDEPSSISYQEEKYVPSKSKIKIGSALPYGIRLSSKDQENIVRLKDIGVNKRILLIGVIGSFTPDCWNRHLFQVLKHFDYLQVRGVHNICCIATNDAHQQSAWGQHLGITDKILMWSDFTTSLTQEIGMGIIVPWLDNKIRSRRYVMLADDMIVKKMIVAPDSADDIKWECSHCLQVGTK